MANAVGVAHPAEITAEHLDLLDDELGSVPVAEHFGYKPDWGVPSFDQLTDARAALWGDVGGLLPESIRVSRR